jgi:Zn-dependent protease
MDLKNFPWEMLLLGYPVLLLALTVHESAHAWTAEKFGDSTARNMGRVSLNPIVHMDIFGTVLFPIFAMITGFPLIGWAKPVPVNSRFLNNPSRDNMFISLAGPFSNILLALSLFLLLVVLSVSGILYSLPVEIFKPLRIILNFGVLINVLLAIFNMIPVPPLDGSHVLEHFLPYPWAEKYEMIKPYGFLIILVLFYAGLFRLLIMPVWSVLSVVLAMF